MCLLTWDERSSTFQFIQSWVWVGNWSESFIDGVVSEKPIKDAFLQRPKLLKSIQCVHSPVWVSKTEIRGDKSYFSLTHGLYLIHNLSINCLQLVHDGKTFDLPFWKKKYWRAGAMLGWWERWCKSTIIVARRDGWRRKAAKLTSINGQCQL